MRKCEMQPCMIQDYEFNHCLFQNKCWLYYPDHHNANELVFDEVDLTVRFTSEREYRHYTQRIFQLKHLIVRRLRRGNSPIFSSMIVSRQVNLAQSFIGQISIGQIMVLRTTLNRFYSYSVMFVSAVHSICSMVPLSFTVVQVTATPAPFDSHINLIVSLFDRDWSIRYICFS